MVYFDLYVISNDHFVKTIILITEFLQRLQKQ